MVEAFRRDPFDAMVKVATIIGLIVPSLAAIAGGIMWFTGAFAGNAITARDVAEIKGQMAQLATVQDVKVIKDQMAQLQADVRLVPRANDLAVLDRHLSAEDGRMDGIDTRLRDIESRFSSTSADLTARIRSLEDATHTRLNSR